MNLYEKYILPPILNCACGLPLLRSHRQDIVKRARGSVLEIGIGSSLNKDFYNHEQITGIVGLDPNESLLKIAQINESDQPNTINLSGGLSEQLPFPTCPSRCSKCFSPPEPRGFKYADRAPTIYTSVSSTALSVEKF